MTDLKDIEEIVYDLCVQANTVLPDDVFDKILNAYKNEMNEDAKQALGLILTNAQLSAEKKMPLCQDTGQVLVFVKGKNIPVNINELVNNAVAKAYKENYFRQSVVKNALFDRTNTKTNTPCIIYTEVADCELEIDILLKGGGSENVCATQMLSPTSTEDEIIDFVVSIIKKAGAKACPPYFIGIGIGGTMEYAGILSKKALLSEDTEAHCAAGLASPTYFDETQSKLFPSGTGGLGNPPYSNEQSNDDGMAIPPYVDDNKKLAEKIKTEINKIEIGAAGLGGASTALDVKILTDFTHIACMPVAVTINCHSMRHASYKEKGKREKGKLSLREAGVASDEAIQKYPSSEFLRLASSPRTSPSPASVEEASLNVLKIHSSEVDKLKSLKAGQNILLSGEIYTARDMAHKRLLEMMEKGEELPFDLKDKIIFYAGPCPCSDECIVGSIGPTTSARMDKFAPIFYKKGVLATIGKGERSEEVKEAIKETCGLYFTIIGGIACYLSEKFKKKELIAFEDLGAEAIYKFEVEDLPLRLDLC